MAEGLPTVEIPVTEISGMQVAELAVRAGLAASKGEARRLIAQGGLTLNDIKPAGEHDIVDLEIMALKDRTFVLNAGKKRRVLIKLK